MIVPGNIFSGQTSRFLQSLCLTSAWFSRILMPQSFPEYVEWLDQRNDLIWPKPPQLQPIKARPHTKPLGGIRAVLWNLYGTLLRVTDGELLLYHHTALRMQIALEKTISEFKMWHSMKRTPGAPWEYMLQKYRGVLEDLELRSPVETGDFPQVISSRIWRQLIEMLEQKEYQYDVDFHGGLDDFAKKVAYFFQANLQGVEASPNALQTLVVCSKARLVQGVLADTQPYTLTQTLRAFQGQGNVPPLGSLFDPHLMALSHEMGVRKPSQNFFSTAVGQLARREIDPKETLYVSSRIQGDLAVARQYGFRTVLYAGDKSSFKASPQELNHADIRPRRLITDLSQIRHLIGIE
jgi:FMN phosphatase YigB (HAD superfamily)